MNDTCYWVGIDVGSTTVKITVVQPETKELLFYIYRRHNADQAKAVYELLETAHERFPDAEFKVAVCGSGGLSIAKELNAFYIQEVVANALAVRTFYKNARVAVELGGQDAKVIFFRYDEASGQLVANDMRMNGSCAGGTGAFIDQVAELLHVKTEEFGALAAAGTHLYDISGRCGVFAKTDIQPLLNQGVSKEDIALSSFHAIAKQTIGGLAQGMDIVPPVIFEGGPLTFNPKLVEVFKERLRLSDGEVIIPDKPEILVAIGAALSVEAMFHNKQSQYKGVSSLKDLKNYIDYKRLSMAEEAERFFKSEEERQRFHKRHPHEEFTPKTYPKGTRLEVYLGIDAGSTTTKFVLLDRNGELVDKFYSGNHGDPLLVIKYALIKLRDTYKEAGVELIIKGVGTTGYGEVLFAKAFNADYHTVETVAHAEAAQAYAPGATFILDIGGQDMKAISLKGGIVTGIILNEACSAGCGSFIETYARSLGVAVDKIASMAFAAKKPSRLGSRCTVFMNSSIITEQKNGKTTGDILAGISRSIIENVFTKVIRISNLDVLGDRIVVQGGTFKNDAVLRAFEQYTGQENITRPPHPGEMGAIGIALLTKKYVEEKKAKGYTSTFLGLDNLEQFDYEKKPGLVCTFCSNNCNRTLVLFNNGTRYVTGNRCERGEIIGDASDPEVKKLLTETTSKLKSVPDLMKLQNQLLFKDYKPKLVSEKRNIRIGIPRALEFWASIPYWKALFTSLGFEVIISPKSSYDIFENGLRSVPSDTICFPAKLVHGHVQELIKRKVDRIFMPMMIRIPKENKFAQDTHVCAVVQGYPMVVEKTDQTEKRYGIPFDNPTFHWYNKDLKHSQTADYLGRTFGISAKEAKLAIAEAEKALTAYFAEMRAEGKKVLETLKHSGQFGVVLAGRPYHSDELVNHDLSLHFTRLGIPVLVLDALELHDQDLSRVRVETYNPFHTRMLSAAMYVAKNPLLEIVQIVSFGCGHDAILSDEMTRILRETADKELLILKLDEGEAKGPLNIRIKSFIETIRVRREHLAEKAQFSKYRELQEAFAVKFRKADKKQKTVLAPNLSPAFSTVISAMMKKEGFSVYQMPLADERAIELGKKYVHNDICFPAQVNIGEALCLLEKGVFSPDEVALGLAKNCEDCRAGQYAVLARKALDEAGYPQVPIVTSGSDTKNMHPGAKFSPFFLLDMAWGLILMDGLEYMRKTTRPYELEKGRTNEVFDAYLNRITEALTKSHRKALKLFKEAVRAFNEIPVDRTVRRPRAGIVGEILLNYHPTSNSNVEKYLEEHGMEVYIPPMIDFFRKGYVIDKNKAKRGLIPHPVLNYIVSSLYDGIIAFVLKKMTKAIKDFRFAKKWTTINDIMDNIRGHIDISYIAGEGWLIPGDIIQMIKDGINSFIIVQPFGCLPNHITGRGLTKMIKDMYPHVQILSLDFDPDTSFANVENRLQMLIITAYELEKKQHLKEKQEIPA